MPPTLAEIASSAFRCASLRAATIRSCSISTSSLETTSGSIFSDCTCLAPLTTTVTMPPPALPSTRASAICFCRRSCICCACFIICWTCWMFIASYISSTSRISAGKISSIACTLVSAIACSRSAAFLSAAFCSSTAGRAGRRALHGDDGQLAAGGLRRNRFEPRALFLERVAQRPLVRQERERHLVAGDLDLLRLRDHRVVEDDLVLANLGEERVLDG